MRLYRPQDMLYHMAFPGEEQLHELISPVTTAYGLDIEGIKVTRAGKKSVVSIKLDADERPTLDDLEPVSKEVGEVLDDSEERGQVSFGAGYTLEVSSPGVDLPLTAPRHWRRNRHRLVEINESGEKTIWRIGAVNQEESHVIVVRSHAKKLQARDLEISSVPSAVVEIEFNNPPEAELEITGKTYQEAMQWREENK